MLARFGWSADDSRSLHVKHFLERVRDAGLSLVSDSDRNRLEQRHLEPSMTGNDLVPDGARVLDFGSGGGFPAIPLAIARPDVSWLLVESSARKTAFLARVSRETQLSNVEVLTARVEMLSAEYNARFDVITARAVAELPELIDWTRRLLKPGGRWLLWKGEKWRQEADLAQLKLILKQEMKLSDGGRLLWLETEPDLPPPPREQGGIRAHDQAHR
ncbi:16S rRNA (guanine(527)-N(7))-methyltransferase RsmG [candidate division KSB1 bacterium]|nr:16S rRNA (guanine(527)-N(7))-methyltransferase RsmG [candidate division KSB1 bacterium]